GNDMQRRNSPIHDYFREWLYFEKCGNRKQSRCRTSRLALPLIASVVQNALRCATCELAP
ncbi:MAG: hypothetical protein ACP5M0_05115, partial [Desulfomonilaceae bacterium]